MVKISVGTTGVIFRVGDGKHAMLDKTIVCDFEQAETMLEIALSKIRNRK